MTPLDSLLIGVMLVMILVMLYFMSKLIKDDPTLWSAVRDKDQWINIWTFGEKLQPEKNRAILSRKPEDEEEETLPAE